eukprot:362489-Chlamydomonas_euryale.AAC.1
MDPDCWLIPATTTNLPQTRAFPESRTLPLTSGFPHKHCRIPVHSLKQSKVCLASLPDAWIPAQTFGPDPCQEAPQDLLGGSAPTANAPRCRRDKLGRGAAGVSCIRADAPRGAAAAVAGAGASCPRARAHGAPAYVAHSAPAYVAHGAPAYVAHGAPAYVAHGAPAYVACGLVAQLVWPQLVCRSWDNPSVGACVPGLGGGETAHAHLRWSGPAVSKISWL